MGLAVDMGWTCDTTKRGHVRLRPPPGGDSPRDLEGVQGAPQHDRGLAESRCPGALPGLPGLRPSGSDPGPMGRQRLLGEVVGLGVEVLDRAVVVDREIDCEVTFLRYMGPLLSGELARL